jgi:hypothetical protein
MYVRWFQAFAATVFLGACATSAQGERYRGDYTFGHEVNTFCPAINSQCYWLGPNSNPDARARLKRIYQDSKPGLYKPVCVVIEGIIDRDTRRTGFAADYDGLIDITRVEGDCASSGAVTPGDLNHRRWVLNERDGLVIGDQSDRVVIDFGERLFVEITEGCRRFSGFAELEADRIRFDSLDLDLTACTGGATSPGVFPGKAGWRLVLRGRDGLELASADTRLVFRRDDWR